MKKYLIILISVFFFNNISLADKYNGRGEIILNDMFVDYFIQYVQHQNDQSPMIFLFAISESGELLYPSYWFCPGGNCRSPDKPRFKKRCELDAKKYAPGEKYVECFIFAKKRTIVWDNDINPMTRKESKISSKWSRSQVIEKLTELGFYDGESMYIEKKERKTTNENTSNDSNTISLSEQIQKLNKLYQDGIITKEEFKKAKKKILN